MALQVFAVCLHVSFPEICDFAMHKKNAANGYEDSKFLC